LERLLALLQVVSSQIGQLWKNAASKPPNFDQEFHNEITPSLHKIIAINLQNRSSVETFALFRIRIQICQLVTESPFLWFKKANSSTLGDSSKDIAKSLGFSGKIVRWLAEIPQEQAPTEIDTATAVFMKSIYLVWDNFT
jgi:hypothetical protein